MKVRLFVPNVDPPDDGFVVEGTIPEFNKPPDVIVWGIRVFKFHKMYESSWRGPGRYLHYEEAFCVALIDTVQEKAA